LNLSIADVDDVKLTALYKYINDEYLRIVNLKLRELRNSDGSNQNQIIKDLAE
jgi:hypothetical protein